MNLSLARLIESGRALDHAETAPPVLDRELEPLHERTTERPAPTRARASDARTVVPLSADGPATAVPAGPRDRGPVGSSADRRHLRVPYHLPVTVYGPASFCAGVVEDLSESGAFVRTPWPFPVDSIVEFVLELPDDTVLVHAIVRWRRMPGGETAATPGMGLQFLELSPPHREALRAFVAIADEEPR